MTGPYPVTKLETSVDTYYAVSRIHSCFVSESLLNFNVSTNQKALRKTQSFLNPRISTNPSLMKEKGSQLMKNFNNILPTEIISDILTRLPTEVVIECKLVCKTWKNLIHHRSFPQMHLARLNHPDSPDSGKLRYVILKPDEDIDDYNYNKRIYYFEYDDNEDWNCVKPIHRKICLEIPYCEAYILIGSFNGLICTYGFQPSSYYTSGPAIVFNPVTKEYIVLRDSDSLLEFEKKGENSIRCYHLACGFGYLAETNEYKVIKIYKDAGDLPHVVEVEVYTVGSCKGWRHVGKFDLGFIFYPDCVYTHGAFLNGALHWRDIDGGMVVVFDLADEKFRESIPPPPMVKDIDEDEDVIVIGVAGGGILYYAVQQSVEGQEFNDVWMFMKKNDDLEKEEHQSWGWIQVTNLDQREPVAFMDDGDVVRYDQGNFKMFLPGTSTWESILNNNISCQVFPYKLTLVSLKALGEENVKIMRICEN